MPQRRKQLLQWQMAQQLPSLTTPRGFTQADIRNPSERYGNCFLQIVLVILFVIAHLGVKEILNWSHDSLYGLQKWSVGKSDILLSGSPPWRCLARRSSSRGSTLSPSAVPSFCSTLPGSVNYHAIIGLIAKIYFTWIEIFVRRDLPSSSIFVINLETKFCKSRPRSSVWLWWNWWLSCFLKNGIILTNL